MAVIACAQTPDDTGTYTFHVVPCTLPACAWLAIMRIDVRTHIHISFNYYPASDDWGTGTYTFTRDDLCCLLKTV